MQILKINSLNNNKLKKRLMNIVTVYVSSQSSDNSFLKALYDNGQINDNTAKSLYPIIYNILYIKNNNQDLAFSINLCNLHKSTQHLRKCNS